VSHRHGGKRQEVRTVLPPGLRLVDELQIGFVDERRRGQGALSLAGTPVFGEVAMRDDAQFLIQQCYQAVERLALTAAKCVQHIFARRCRRQAEAIAIGRHVPESSNPSLGQSYVRIVTMRGRCRTLPSFLVF
jgi:hypothetical protein